MVQSTLTFWRQHIINKLSVMNCSSTFHQYCTCAQTEESEQLVDVNVNQLFLVWLK